MKLGFKIALSAALIGAAALVFNAFSAAEKMPLKQTMTTMAGKPIQIADYQGKVVLVNFWATSCTGCIAEMPGLVAAQNKLGKDKLITIAVAMSYDNPTYIENYLAKMPLPFEMVYDQSGEIARAFGEVQLTPTSFLLDPKGRLIKKIVGEISEQQLIDIVNEAHGA
ncbi:TlpA family protein disulfide reductase [Deefgea piscis]|uniref:TlpA family protein disulfide reductase n=1 Tax=Deefgea piscis TaxID=2739061 RepID=A0A6M8SJS0_9NEIS|nr:TlpA disulfide reductase family protein [Deefgea piscis]QKJ65295.1 TlpA family protein disulfide reductase [Deefgea piscis]